MRKNLFAVVVFAVGILGITAAYADDVVSDEQQVVQKTEESRLWNWFKHTDVSFKTMEYRKPTWSFETVLPLYQTPDSLNNTLFFQGRWAYRNIDNTINLGLGYRYLLEDQSWLFGVNGFYDLTTRYNHQRFSAGAEAIGTYVALRANYYQALQEKKTISTIDLTTNYEEALRGYDAEFDAPVPFLPWMRAAVNVFRFHTRVAGVDNIQGNTLLIRGNLAKYISLELGCRNDNKLFSQKYIMIAINILGTTTNGVQATMTDRIFDHKAFEARDLMERTLDKVPRLNDVVIESTSIGKGVAKAKGVTFRRGT